MSKIRLGLKSEYLPDEEERADIDRIVSIFRNRGYRLSKRVARDAWLEVSEYYACGWMLLDSYDESVFNNIMPYLREVSQ